MATELGKLNGILDREVVTEFFELFDSIMRRKELITITQRNGIDFSYYECDDDSE